MSSIFTIDSEDNEQPSKLSIDDLYEKKQQKDLKVLQTYKNILSKVHNKIKIASRQRNNNEFCWFVVPEVILGNSNYNNNDCIVYIIKQLEENGFRIQYTHPNVLLISWKHWIPYYVRQEFKKNAGIEIDGMGNVIKKDDDGKIIKEPFQTQNQTQSFDYNPNLFLNNNITQQTNNNTITINDNNNESNKNIKIYKDTNSYKPTGNLIYSKNIIENIQNKFS